jgi:aminopeptidase N
VFDSARKKAKTARDDLTPEEQAAQDVKDNFYRFTFRNIGGLVMPVILKMDFTDGTTETIRIPAEIWRKNSKAVTWQYVSPKELKGAEIDPLWETADADRGNNVFDGAITPTTLKIRSRRKPGEPHEGRQCEGRSGQPGRPRRRKRRRRTKVPSDPRARSPCLRRRALCSPRSRRPPIAATAR